jgi:hypothetical protein
MKRKRYSVEQIMAAVKQHEAGMGGFYERQKVHRGI